jgi:hypothetical protein
MSQNQESTNTETGIVIETTDNETTNQKPTEPSVGEFKVTVRKLEMPVRPRGVLAE